MDHLRYMKRLDKNSFNLALHSRVSFPCISFYFSFQLFVIHDQQVCYKVIQMSVDKYLYTQEKWESVDFFPFLCLTCHFRFG